MDRLKSPSEFAELAGTTALRPRPEHAGDRHLGRHVRPGERRQRPHPHRQAGAAQARPGRPGAPAGHRLPRLLRERAVGAGRAGAHFYPKVGLEAMARIIDAVAQGEVVEDLLYRRPLDRQAHRAPGRHPVLPPPGPHHPVPQRAGRPDPHHRLRRGRRLRRARRHPRTRRPALGHRRGQGGRGCAAAAAPASRPASSGSCSPSRPTAAASSSSATPTRATPAPTWTARCSRATRTASSRGC